MAAYCVYWWNTFISFADKNRVEVEFKSDMSSEVQKLIPNAEDYLRQLQQFIDDILDQKVAKTDMNMRHIYSKSLEVKDASHFSSSFLSLIWGFSYSDLFSKSI